MLSDGSMTVKSIQWGHVFMVYLGRCSSTGVKPYILRLLFLAKRKDNCRNPNVDETNTPL